MFIRTRENYREVFKSIVGLKPDLRIFVLTLFNTGGRDLPGAREINYHSSVMQKIFFIKKNMNAITADSLSSASVNR